MDFRVFIEAEVGQNDARGPHYPPGRARGSLRALVPSGTRFHLLVAFGLCLVLIFCKVKNKQKTTTGIGHYVNRLVPKMI